MKEFFSSRKFKVLLGVASMLLGFMVYTGVRSGGVDLITGTLGAIVAPFQRLSSSITRSATEFFERILKADDISKENSELREDIRRLREQMVDFETYKAENEQYRQFLELKKDNPDFVFEAAMVIGRDPTDFFYSFTIDKGTIDGIKLLDPVITPDGLVGRVSEVSYTDSKVITILNPGIDVGAFDGRTRDTGIITGDLTLARDNMCKMTYLSRDSSASAGDLISTSGIGGVFPKGLIIGTIADVKAEENGISLYAEIVPTTNIPQIRDVFVITSFRGQTPVEGEPQDTPQ